MKLRVKRSYALTDEADKLLGKMADKNGISKSAVLEIIIREAARLQGIEIDSTATVGPV